jgi:hypothetical protein
MTEGDDDGPELGLGPVKFRGQGKNVNQVSQFRLRQFNYALVMGK